MFYFVLGLSLVLAAFALILVSRCLWSCLTASWAPDESLRVAVLRRVLRGCRRVAWKSDEAATQLRDRWLGLGYILLATVAAVMDMMVNYRRLPVVFAIGPREGLLLAVALPVLAAGAGLMMHAALHSERAIPPASSEGLAASRTVLWCGGLFLTVLSCGTILKIGFLIVGAVLVMVVGLALCLILKQSRTPQPRTSVSGKASVHPFPLIIAIVLLGCNMGLQGFANFSAVKILLEEREVAQTSTDSGISLDSGTTGGQFQSASDVLAPLPWVFAMLAAVLALSEASFAYFAKQHFLAWRCMAMTREAKLQGKVMPIEKALESALVNLRAKVGLHLRSIRQHHLRQTAYKKSQHALELRLAGLIHRMQELSARLGQLLAKPPDPVTTLAREGILEVLRVANREIVQLGRADVQKRDLDALKQLVTDTVNVYAQAQADLERSFAGITLEPQERADLLKLLNSLRAEKARAVAAFHSVDAMRLTEADQSLEQRLRLLDGYLATNQKEEHHQ